MSTYAKNYCHEDPTHDPSYSMTMPGYFVYQLGETPILGY